MIPATNISKIRNTPPAAMPIMAPGSIQLPDSDLISTLVVVRYGSRHPGKGARVRRADHRSPLGQTGGSRRVDSLREGGRRRYRRRPRPGEGVGTGTFTAET